jgi:uncharacterized protein
VHIPRIILEYSPDHSWGTFDRHPDLQIVIGHLSEALPLMLSRLEVMPTAMTKLRRPISAYLRENIYYTFSGFNFTSTFLDLLLQVGTDRIIFTADYPYGSMLQARAFLDGLPVSNADKEKIAHGAEQLFRV